MAVVLKVFLIVWMFYLATYNRSQGFPINLEETAIAENEDLDPALREEVQQLLQEAVKKLDEDDVQIPVKSLSEKMRKCFSAPVPGGKKPDSEDDDRLSNRAKRDLEDESDLLPDMGPSVRLILQEAIKEVDEKGILDTMKWSLYQRLKKCLTDSTSHTSGPFRPTGGRPTDGKPTAKKPRSSKPIGKRPKAHELLDRSEFSRIGGFFLNGVHIKQSLPKH